MRLLQIALVLCCILNGKVSLGLVTQFEETFDGDSLTTDETRQQLEAAGWTFSSDGRIVAGDLALSNSSEFGESSDTLYRLQSGFGSFLMEVKLRDLDLDNLVGPGSIDLVAGLTVDVSLKDGNNRSTWAAGIHLSELVGMPEFDDNLNWRLILGSEISLVPKVSSEIELGFAYNSSERILTVIYNDALSVLPNVKSYFLSEDVTSLPESLMVSMKLKANGGAHSSVNIKEWSLVRLPEVSGDFSRDGAVDVEDANLLLTSIAEHSQLPWYDLDFNNRIDQADLQYWIHDLKKTYYGDANLDGEFDSADLVNIFAEGKYEDGIATNARWESGDWNADLEFDTGDLVVAFQDGGYEQGPEQAAAVPEAVSLPLVLLSSLWCLRRRERSLQASQRNVR